MSQRTRCGKAAALAAAVLLAACSEAEGEEGAPAVLEELPTPEEALERATEEIDAENADDELERLKKEMGQDG